MKRSGTTGGGGLDPAERQVWGQPFGHPFRGLASLTAITAPNPVESGSWLIPGVNAT